MKYLSVCSGIEAASVAWHHLGWEPVGFAEIEKFPSQVLAHRFPGVPNLGDMTKFREWDIEPGTVDILVGGTPCQAFSVAGLRKGLADPRGNLALTFVAMVDHYRPEWVVWENVPGVLSSSGGRDFGAFLGALGQLGYGFAYRVLDAQYFGVAQRRRRVFVVAHASGDPRRAAEVLFEPESLRGDPPPSRETRQATTDDPGSSTPGGNLWDTVGALCADTHPGAYSGQDAYTGRIIPSLYESQPIGLDEEKNAYIDLFGTLMARTEGGGFEGTVLQPSLYESHPNDSRVTGPVEQCPTVSAQWGTGGNNTPLVTDGATAYSIAPGRQGTAEKVDDIHVTEQDTSRTLDCTGACQERRQGGTLIVQPSFAYDDRSQAVSMDTHHTPLVTDNSLGFQSKASFCTGIESGISVPITTESIPAVVYPDAVVQPGEALPLAYDDRNQAVSTDTHHTPLVTDGGTHFRKSKRAQSVNDDETWVESDVTNTMNVFDQGDVRATDVVVQPGEASAQLHMIAQSDFVQPFAQNQLGEVRAGEVFNTINTNSNANGRNTPLVQTAMHVRRLTPVECERLQGFPDGWTDIRPGGKDTPDSPRYKALGNSMAVPVMRWIGERIAKASRG